MTDEPAALAEIRDAGRAAGIEPCPDIELGRWIRVLAVSKPGGALLHIADGSGELAAWIAQDMDLSSRLVALIGEPRVADALGRTLGDDLRVTLHRQDVDAFLDDVKAHRFDLIVHDQVPTNPLRVDAAWTLLAPGGLLVIPGLPGPREAPGERAIDRVAGVVGALPDARVGIAGPGSSCVIAARRTPRPAPIRRGGRRARRGDNVVTGLVRPRS